MKGIIKEFKEYCISNINQYEDYDFIKESKKYLELFLTEYPLTNFSNIELNNYVIGNGNKDSLCYKMEFGKYKYCGPGIGGSNAYKYGIFYSKEKREYISQNGIENNPESKWIEIRDALYKVLKDLEKANKIDEIYDDYSSLKRMSIFINKLAFCYFPTKLVGIAGRKQLLDILNLFELEYNEKYSSLKLSFLINKYIRENIVELSNIHPSLLGALVWDFYILKSKENDDNKKLSNAKFIKWFRPLLEALKELGGSGTPKEVREKIAEMENLPSEILEEVRGKSQVNKFENDVAFAKSYLVHEGLIDGSEHGIWKITDKGNNINMTPQEASNIFFKWVKILKTERDKKSKNVLNINYWLVGAYWDQEGDQTKRFIEEGTWENGYINKYLDIVKQIMPGDKIAIKSTYTKTNEIPFNANGKKVSVMKIKVTGTVIENFNDGKKIKVKWDEMNEREWYMFTDLRTIWNITPHKQEDWMKEDLVKFVFENKEQDYQRFINDPYWNDRYEYIENEESEEIESYKKQNFLEDVYISELEYEKMINLIKRKKNIILQGPPGVGKTYMAKRLVYSLIGEKNNKRIKFVQFHQSYSYEDFIEGWRPTESSFKIEDGSFKTFCEKAKQNQNNDYFFIIDEINRGNLSKIFGELLMLIECDKRNEELDLAYSKKPFSVPNNVYIIGMMNTADRSLALIDYALRRRFAFYTVDPFFDNEKFKEYQKNLNSEKFDELIDIIKKLNVAIEKDATLGKGFKIGHSYFCNFENITDDDIDSIINYEILPLLEEYWFDDLDQYNDWKEKLDGVING